MPCLLCGHDKTHNHGTTSIGSQRYLCPVCHKTFTETFDTIYYRRHLDAEQVHTILQAHASGGVVFEESAASAGGLMAR